MDRKITEFFVETIPPRKTHQDHVRCAVRGGKVFMYKDKHLVGAEQELMFLLRPHKRIKYSEPIKLTVVLVYPYRKSEAKKNRTELIPKTTRPDADNLAKTLQDVMTKLEFWDDDSLIVELQISKFYGERSGIGICIEPFVLSDTVQRVASLERGAKKKGKQYLG